jgi:hypothetical protein
VNSVDIKSALEQENCIYLTNKEHPAPLMQWLHPEAKQAGYRLIFVKHVTRGILRMSDWTVTGGITLPLFRTIGAIDTTRDAKPRLSGPDCPTHTTRISAKVNHCCSFVPNECGVSFQLATILDSLSMASWKLTPLV